MNRRTFLCGLTLGTLSMPLAAEAQRSGQVPRIGFLSNGKPSARISSTNQSTRYSWAR